MCVRIEKVLGTLQFWEGQEAQVQAVRWLDGTFVILVAHLGIKKVPSFGSLEPEATKFLSLVPEDFPGPWGTWPLFSEWLHWWVSQSYWGSMEPLESHNGTRLQGPGDWGTHCKYCPMGLHFRLACPYYWGPWFRLYPLLNRKVDNPRNAWSHSKAC
jgi:hypothetical protein